MTRPLFSEFDQQLESHRVGVDIGGTSDLGMNDLDARMRQLEAERADLELMSAQHRFSENMDQLNMELDLLRRHTLMLKEQLQQLDVSLKAQA